MPTAQILRDAQAAADKLAAGHLCAIPTETVYGLAADASNEAAVSRVFEAKGRPHDHPLIVHIADVSHVGDWILDLPEWAIVLANAVWPGPLTVVGARTNRATDNITGGQETVAVRVPDHYMTLELLANVHERGILGLVAPSANSFGHVSPTTADHVQGDLGKYLANHGDVILNGGPCVVGVESTIVLATGDQPVVLRPGAITQDDIERITGVEVLEHASNAPRVSGALASHYAPSAKVILITAEGLSQLSPSDMTQSAGLIAMAHIATPHGLTRINSPQTTTQFAAELYASMRQADALNIAVLYVVAPSGTGIERAIADRLARAATKGQE